jgi:hypothetical protein
MSVHIYIYKLKKKKVGGSATFCSKCDVERICEDFRAAQCCTFRSCPLASRMIHSKAGFS